MKNHKWKLFTGIISICIIVLFSIVYSKDEETKKPELKFNKNGSFKIVQFTDSQDGPYIDPRTIILMNKILDYENPDLVVLTGDNIDGKSKSVSDVKKAIDNIAQPMEKRHIPWAIVFGNHDEDHHKMNKEEMLKIYMSYPYNISQVGFKDTDRIGNYNLLVKGSKGNDPIFNIYMLDSGAYAENSNEYAWIKPNQIAWYKNTADKLKEKYNRVIPALMFFHIPLPEWNKVWDSGTAIGSKNEEVSCPKVNSGLFDELVRTQDVKGVFAGHDHRNDFVGELEGIKLGCSRNIGYGTYGKKGFSRGGRVFLINESNPSKFETWMRLEEHFRN